MRLLFLFVLFMPSIRIPFGTPFLTTSAVKLTQVSRPCWLRISMLFLIGWLTVWDPLPRIPPVKVLWPFVACLTSAVLRTFGTIFIPLSLVSPGLGGITRVPPAPIFSGSFMPGSRMSFLATFWRVLSLIIVVFFYPCLSRTSFPQVLASGS